MAAKLRVVTGGRSAGKTPKTSVRPARKLGRHGQSLWDAVMSEYEIGDAGGVEMLTQSCQQLDRAEALRVQIERDGEIITSKKYGVRDHPGLKHELAARAFVVRTLMRLGLDMESVKPVGRPGKHHGITHEQLDAD